MTELPRRSLLFAPGSRPDIFDKALASEADMVCVDLEDAVAPPLKADARKAGVAFLAGGGAGAERVLRINAIGSADGLRDLLAIVEAAPASGIVFLPKVDGADEIRVADKLLTEAGSALRLMALIETAKGLENVGAIASATPRLELLLFGAVDLSAELGVAVAHEPLLYARSRVVHAARTAGVGVFDVPSLNFRDHAALEAEARTAASLGFTGKGVLHPSAVGIVNQVFSPSPAEVRQARTIVDAFEASETGLVVIDGKLIELPVVRSMRRTLAIAEAAGIEPAA